MRSFVWLASFLVASLFCFTGCANSKQAYRDPLTYSFEAKPTSTPPQSEWQNLKEKASETAKKIRAWESRYLW